MSDHVHDSPPRRGRSRRLPKLKREEKVEEATRERPPFPQEACELLEIRRYGLGYKGKLPNNGLQHNFRQVGISRHSSLLPKQLFIAKPKSHSVESSTGKFILVWEANYRDLVPVCLFFNVRRQRAVLPESLAHLVEPASRDTRSSKIYREFCLLDLKANAAATKKLGSHDEGLVLKIQRPRRNGKSLRVLYRVDIMPYKGTPSLRITFTSWLPSANELGVVSSEELKALPEA